MDIDQADYDHFCVDKNGNEGFSEVLKHASEQVDGWGQFCGLGRTGGRFETPVVDEDEERIKDFVKGRQQKKEESWFEGKIQLL
ncbi:hypothetical protein CH063_04263 [Colletotrichum higginsianum]|uniref:Endo alpha-1,4 polygalactosaminidase n=1 Tax=Colletotrichum higginsianum (strain IMI 349063) TaxID=759273 RepID=H1W5G4_COLHI|nr:endo alpha-1,4 polygalactosaminidase [Colletotrichum higginsianum IMI 349063]OBR15900.1 endo alpha-1,4 polygalactosaminidase [Colletotrichum higginsianum IMI 349063]CCF47728.1 hypothetical protein CH063_04263 [Colletotrichum higginsianum]